MINFGSCLNQDSLMKFYSLLCRYAFCIASLYICPAVAATSRVEGFKVNAECSKQADRVTIKFYFTKNGEKLDFDSFFSMLKDAFSVGDHYKKKQKERQALFNFLAMILKQVEKNNMWNGFGTEAPLTHSPFQIVIQGESCTGNKESAFYYDYMTQGEAYIRQKYKQLSSFDNQFRKAKNVCRSEFENNKEATTLACVSQSGRTILVIPSEDLATIFHMKNASKEQIWSFFSMIAYVMTEYRDYIANWAIHTTPRHAQTVPRLHFRLELNAKGRKKFSRNAGKLLAVQQVIKNKDNTHNINTFVIGKTGEEKINERQTQEDLLDIDWNPNLWHNSQPSKNSDKQKDTPSTSWSSALVTMLLRWFR